MAATRKLSLRAAEKVAGRIPGLRMLPIVRLVMVAEVLMLGKHHLDRLTPAERRQLIQLVRKAKARPKNLTLSEQEQLNALVVKLEPRVFMAEATEKLSPVGVPGPVLNKIAGKPQGVREAGVESAAGAPGA